MNSCELVTTITAIACAIAKCVPEEDLPLLISVFGQLASTLGTITVKEEIAKGKDVTEELPPEPTPASEIIITP